jgi:hypothetical protein
VKPFEVAHSRDFRMLETLNLEDSVHGLRIRVAEPIVSTKANVYLTLEETKSLYEWLKAYILHKHLNHG